MNTIKFNSNGTIAYITRQITIAGQNYKVKTELKAYLIGELPQSIVCIVTQNETEGIPNWITYKGHTYLDN